jgi:hypothetical protein
VPNPKEQSFPERVFPQRPISRWLPASLRDQIVQHLRFRSKEDAEYFMAEVIHFVHDQGFFISGQITIDDKRACGNCGSQMIWMPEHNQHRCPRCMALVLEAVESENNLPRSEDIKNRASVLSDSKLCPACGGLCIRTGTCYTCQECGANEGCG